MERNNLILKNDNLFKKRKEEIINTLKDAFSEGQLQLDEFENRIVLAEQANQISEIEYLISDIEVDKNKEMHSNIAEVEKITGKMITKKISGTILKTKRFEIDVNMSTIKMDYRDIKIIDVIQEINVNMEMSNLILYLPDDVVVENRMQEEMSTFSEIQNKYYDPEKAKAIIRISGRTKMSTVKVKRKRYWFRSKKY
jgi:hypothetical protein